MKKLIVLTIAFLTAGIASAQNYMVVNTETIFKSIEEYNTAVDEIDAAAKQYQQNIDNAYAELEEMYQTYMSVKSSLSPNARYQQEETILGNEQKIQEYQQDVFGENGKMAQMQTEKLEPYQKKVMETISQYAADNEFGLVLDISTNPMVVYYSPEVDMTDKIIELLK